MITAKKNSGGTQSLLHHTLDTVNAARELFANYVFRRNWLQAFRLGDFGLFWRTLLSALYLHDIGKATNYFEGQILHKDPLALRHEAVSFYVADATMTMLPSQVCKDAMLAGIVCHHAKSHPDTMFPEEGLSKYLELQSSDDDIKDILGHMGLDFCCAAPVIPPLFRSHDDIGTWKNDVLRRIGGLSRRLKGSHPNNTLAIAVKAGVCICDGLGSATHRRKDLNIRSFAAAAFHAPEHDYIEKHLIQPRVKQLTDDGKWHGWHAFQNTVARSPKVTLLRASCGAGKTLAAWRWANAQMNERQLGNAIFCYPTCAAANEGFRDYVSYVPEADRGLLHHASDYDMAAMLECTADEDARTRLSGGESTELEQALYGFARWTRNVYAATVDQFLGFMRYRYDSICSLPAVTNSVLILDEIHTYDEIMFECVLQFIKAFDVPVLMMTATLDAKRQKRILDAGAVLVEDSDSVSDDVPRYTVELVDSASEVPRDALTETDNLLWVSNRVADCQTRAEASGMQAYHSRFMRKDRSKRHAEVIRAFGRGRARVASTQVCECSLDISARTLITELAPVAALVQRFGRCNRYLQGIGRIIVYITGNDRPYSKKEIQNALLFVKELSMMGKVSMRDVLTLYAKYDASPDPEYKLTFVSPCASIRGFKFRAIAPYMRSCVPEQHLEEYLRCKENKEPVAGWVVNVPDAYAQPIPGERVYQLAVGKYDAEYGFTGESE